MGISVNGTAWDLTLYLGQHGIAADDVFANTWDETGYESIVRDVNGRPAYGNTGASRSLLRVRKEWPSPEIPGNLTRIQNGEAPIEPKAEPDPKPKGSPSK